MVSMFILYIARNPISFCNLECLMRGSHNLSTLSGFNTCSSIQVKYLTSQLNNRWTPIKQKVGAQAFIWKWIICMWMKSHFHMEDGRQELMTLGIWKYWFLCEKNPHCKARTINKLNDIWHLQNQTRAIFEGGVCSPDIHCVPVP